MTDLAAEVERLSPWYHTFDLPGGVTTKGFFDLRRVATKVPLPATLAGKRCLDAAACEGFWSFELARRGADEVVSLDLPDTTKQDWQGLPGEDQLRYGSGMANEHFFFVRDVLGATRVERVDMNIYDINPDALGTFDYVFVGNVLMHVADPARALRAMKQVMRPGAELLSLESQSFALTVLGPRIAWAHLWDADDQARWWTLNRAAHQRILHAAGFEVLDQRGPMFQPFGDGMLRWPDRLPRRAREYLFWLVVRRIGMSSGWVRARARTGG